MKINGMDTLHPTPPPKAALRDPFDGQLRALTRPDWTGPQLLSVAGLICDTADGSGFESLVSPEVIAPLIPNSPALGLFDGDRCLFAVSLNPYGYNPELGCMQGLLHFVGTRELKDAHRIVTAFCDALTDTDILAYTDRPALIRMARRAGFRVLRVQDGYTILQWERATSQNRLKNTDGMNGAWDDKGGVPTWNSFH